MRLLGHGVGEGGAELREGTRRNRECCVVGCCGIKLPCDYCLIKMGSLDGPYVQPVSQSYRATLWSTQKISVDHPSDPPRPRG